MMKRVALTAAIAVLCTLPTGRGDLASAQTAPEQLDTLRQQIERRFEVLTLRNSLLLRPRNVNRAVGSIELADGTISIDGASMTGAELRDKLGADADPVIRLSYLDRETRQRLFGAATVTPERTPDAPAVTPERTPDAPAAPPERERPGRSRRERRDRGDGNDQVRFGGSVTVNQDEVVEGDVVAIGGSVRVDGQVTGNAVAIGGSLTLGPRADVQGDAVVIGGRLSRDPGARIGGKVVDVGAGDLDLGGFRWRAAPFGRLFAPFSGAALGFLALMSTLARVAVLCVLASLVLLVGREYVELVGARAVAEPVKAGAIGLLAQLLFIPMLVITILLLVVTIIGIPLLVLVPFAVLALAVIGLVGFTAVASHLGRLVSHRFDWRGDNPYLTVVTGIVLLVSPVLIARVIGLSGILAFPITGMLAFIGFLLEYAAWTVGFGAVALLRFASPGGTVPSAPAATT
jgi:hypothetical protein